MKDILGGILGLGVGAVGCLLYVVFYGVVLVLLLYVGLRVLGWLF